MKTNLIAIASVVIATLTATATLAEAGNKRHSNRGSCDYRQPAAVHHPYRGPVYHHPTVVGHGWGHVAPRPVTACDTTIYRGYDHYRGGYVEERRTVCQPVYVHPRPVYGHPRPSCGPTYRGTRGSISFRF